MKTIISAIIFSKDYKNYDLSEIKIDKFYDSEQEGFDIKCYDSSENLTEILYENRGVDCIITLGNQNDFKELFCEGFEVRKKWVHFDEYVPKNISRAIITTFKTNINRKDKNNPLFSIFTCSYKTPEEFVQRLYNSLKKQTYNNWNWWILDDSPEGEHCFYEDIKDSRVTILKNVSRHGNIGFNKHMIAMCCDGDYLVEVDHDDELSVDCLSYLKKAYDTYPDCDFVYSYCLEEVNGYPVNYDKGFGLGLGSHGYQEYDGLTYYLPLTPDVNVLSVRHIVAMPNHVRCWKKDFYHRIGGHNIDLSVMDDADLIIRTFLNGKTCKVPKVLYVQHEGNTQTTKRGSTTQAQRFNEIVRVGKLLKDKYDKTIHDYAIDNGLEDPYWEESWKGSNIWQGPKEGTVNLNYILDV